MKNKRISDKNKLVKTWCEHKDRNCFKEALGSRQRGRGIYVLYKGDKIYYIGLSKRSLRSRLRKHATRDSHKGKWDNFSFYQIGKKKYIKDVESILLRIYRPKGNKISGKFGRKYKFKPKR